MCILTELQQWPFFVQLTAHWSSVLSSLSITDQTRSQQCHLFGNRSVLPPNLPKEPPDLLQDLTPAPLLPHCANPVLVAGLEMFPRAITGPLLLSGVLLASS